ncbi:MAG: thioredoxin [Actinobacteria bacterium]|nr:thioredoxin [Actinomycetota bacterium]
MSAFVKDVTQEAFGVEVLQRSHEVPVVVDFWAEWCGPCRTLGPALEAAAVAYGGAFELVKVDVDANQQLAQQFRVQSIPTVIAFRDGEPVGQFMGAIGEPQIRQFIEDILPSEADKMVDQARSLVIEGDEPRAEEMFRAVLEQIPDHPDAGTGLAALLIARGEIPEALIMLGKLPRSAEVERLEATARLSGARNADVSELEIRLSADPDDEDARFELGQVLAAEGEYEPALDYLLEVVKAGGSRRDNARQAMVDVFGLLGQDHPLTTTYRRALASALF